MSGWYESVHDTVKAMMRFRNAVLRLSKALLLGTLMATTAVALQVPGGDGSGEDPTASPELDALEKLAESVEKQKKKAEQPRFDLFRSQVLPLDIIPLVKPHHWASLSLDLRANKENYRGVIATAAEVRGNAQVRLLDTAYGMVYRREALLPKEQTVRRGLQVFLPNYVQMRGQLELELARDARSRPEVGFGAIIQRLEPHQMLVPVLSPDPSAYNGWTQFQTVIPSSADMTPQLLDRQRYYRLVIPLEPGLCSLPDHPLTWTTISHLIWDGYSAELLSRGVFSQQQALLDWLHWGGQLIVVAAGPSLAVLEDSSIGSYLPASYTGRGDPLYEADLQALSAAFPPPNWGQELVDWQDPSLMAFPGDRRPPARYKRVEPIVPVESRPLVVSRLEPREHPDVVTIPLGDPSGHHLAVERRVGRGRVVMLAVNPLDPALAKWPGMDTLVRRVLFRRPEENWVREDERRYYRPLGGPDVSWVRYLSRDLGVAPAGNEDNPDGAAIPGDLPLSSQPTAAWIDTTAELPKRTRDTLERASGLTIPENGFVLRVIVVYLTALVPLNWLLCRFVLRKRELAWAIAPLLALGFAYGVERVAAVDLGFESSCDELDLVEIQGGYPRAHVTRFGSLYTNGRVNYELRHPDNPTALMLPMRAYEVLRGEEVRYAAFDSTSEPKLADFLVQPRSLAMFRGESMVDLGGGIELEGSVADGRIVNRTPLELLDARLVDIDSGSVRALGRIGPFSTEIPEGEPAAHVVELSRERPAQEDAAARTDEAWTELENYLALLTEYRWSGAQEAGEVRLVAWARNPEPGLEIAPSVDRHRGVRLVVAHLRYSMPRHDRPPYFYPDQNTDQTSGKDD